MNSITTLLFGIGAIALTSCTNNPDNSASTGDSTSTMETANNNTSGNARAAISATKADTAGSGTADFRTMDDKVELKLVLSFPAKANQTVAVHFHEHGDCGNDGNDSHGHWNPTNEKHGKWGEGEFHSGDIGNVKLDSEGKADLTIASNRWTIGGDDKTNILNRAVIVHSGVDDYKTQPTGNSGSRIGCGVVAAGN